jgi:hypothetical protein
MRAPPVLFLTIYLLAIPGFAVLFWLYCGDGFYAPYAHFESAWTAMAGKLSESYSLVLLGAAKYKDEDALRDGYRSWKQNEVSVRNLTTSDGQHIDFQVRGLLYNPNLKIENDPYKKIRPNVLFFCNVSVDPSITGFALIISDSDGRSILWHPMASQRPSPIWFRFSYSDACPESETAQVFSLDRGFLAAESPPELAAQSLQFLNGFKGSASDVSGNFWRMLYMSAVVITTLGLGDIVPISPLARALVALEAVIGIMIAGLFLNAVAARASGKL